MKYFLFVSILIFITGCTRGYYDTEESAYDYSKAYHLGQDLKDGLLVVQIPCYSKKHEILKAQHKNESDPEKKEELHQKYLIALYELELAQKSLFRGFPLHYEYSDYAFVPDTLIHQLQKGNYHNIFMDSTFNLYSKEDINPDKPILILRDKKDYDDLNVHMLDGKFPPRPFPFSTTVGTTEIGMVSFDKMSSILEKNKFYHAIYVLNQKLGRFYRFRPPSKE